MFLRLKPNSGFVFLLSGKILRTNLSFGNPPPLTTWTVPRHSTVMPFSRKSIRTRSETGVPASDISVNVFVRLKLILSLCACDDCTCASQSQNALSSARCLRQESSRPLFNDGQSLQVLSTYWRELYIILT
jgi:hypothetical protein